MTYKVTEAESLVKYNICHDTDSDMTFWVTVEPIGASVRMSTIREEHFDSICTTFRVFYETTINVQVTLIWVWCRDRESTSFLIFLLLDHPIPLELVLWYFLDYMDGWSMVVLACNWSSSTSTTSRSAQDLTPKREMLEHRYWYTFKLFLWHLILSLYIFYDVYIFI